MDSLSGWQHGTIRIVFEIVNQHASASIAKVAIFDFDGTLSVIRSGWMELMIPLCVKHLAAACSGESVADLTKVAEEFIWRLTGKETIYQMMALADAIKARGGEALEPAAYKREYLQQLNSKIRHRLQELREGISPSRYLVPGSVELLRYLRDSGLALYLASGTDDANVKEEAALLQVAPYFDGKIFGAQDNLQSFSKALLVKRLISEAGYTAAELIVFGDGFVEIEEVKKVGGVAVGVASLEPECERVDPWKRNRLIAAGADFIVPNFLALQEMKTIIFGAKSAASSTPTY